LSESLHSIPLKIIAGGSSAAPAQMNFDKQTNQ
jgi:hypothetical protein